MEDKRVDVLFISRNASVVAKDIERLEKAGFLVVLLEGNPNQVTRRELVTGT